MVDYERELALERAKTAALERELSPRDGETLAQDVEGCILPNGDVCIVQARPQP